MSVVIDKSKCIGCRRCAAICPGNIIRTDGDGKAYLKDPSGCWSCVSCMKECPVQAISLTLPLEAGGRGGQLLIDRRQKITTWHIRKKDGSTEKLVTDTDEANRY